MVVESASTQQGEAQVTLERVGRVAVITLNRAAMRNQIGRAHV